ncbi:MAG TPA: TetR/AcrR family transcriptional regulator [Thermoleophilaceae bacterium]|nr:TetR/AcrR family transcriptional regulator [Thermoleophilaceae bacterium]
MTPGPGNSQEAVLRNQRERLFAATVAVVAEKGYEATRVEDILVKAGISRNAFYKQFANKRECFLATLEEIAKLAKPAVFDVFEQADGSWDEKLMAMLDAFAAAIVAQPAMARVGWVEVYAAGQEAVDIADRIDRSIENIVCRALKDSPERAGMPRNIVRAIVGGVRKMVHTRVREERTGELPALMPELFAWMQSYHAPPERLRRPRRVPLELRTSPAEPVDPRERIVRAVTELVAEKGYPEMAITEIAARASVSLTTFYAHFEGKEAAFLATLAVAQRQVFEATLPHFLAGSDWPTSVSLGARAFLGFLSTHRAMAMLGGVGVWATSPAALEMRAQGRALFETLLDEGYRCYPETSPIAGEAIGASLDALLFQSLQSAGPARLYELGPTATFITLAPFVGSERACQLANHLPVEVA